MAKPIKRYKSPVDENGTYRIYSTYKNGNCFVFDCWDCSVTNAKGNSVGTRKAYNEFNKEEDAIAEYEKYIKMWELDK